MIGDDEITIEELLEKFNIDLNLPIFILTRKVYDIYTKCKVKHDLEDFDYYYEFRSKDKNDVIILTPNVENGYFFRYGRRNRWSPICGHVIGYYGGMRDIN